MSMTRPIVAGVLIVAFMIGAFVGYGIGASSNVDVITEPTTVTTAYLATVTMGRVTITVTVTVNSTLTHYER